MLQESFVLLPNVRRRTERNVWSQGVGNWDDFMAAKKVRGMGVARKARCDGILRDAKLHLREENSAFFAKVLPFSEQWRLFESFRDEAVYLDIETNGYYGGITVVGLSDGFETKTLVRGFNLDRSLFLNELSKYKLLVTFNGASFDLPVIERYFDFKINIPHVDLRFVCKRAGYSGGLKAIERLLGIKRRPEVENMCGEDAVYLWEMWRSTGKREYLDKLVWYNEEDVLNLLPLAKKVIPQVWRNIRECHS